MPNKSHHRFIVYYVLDNCTPQDDPNLRCFYVSNYIGDPFLRFEVSAGGFEALTFEQQCKGVADHLGLKLKQCEFRKRGPQGRRVTP